MNRRTLFSLSGVAAIGAVLPFALDRPSGSAQDNTQAEINDLQTRVAVLETEVAGPPATTAIASPAAVSGGLTFTGSGTSLVGPFHLDAGQYIATIDVTAEQPYDFADVSIIEVGVSDGLSLVSALNKTPFHGQRLIGVTDTADYRLVSKGSDGAKWIITFSKD